MQRVFRLTGLFVIVAVAVLAAYIRLAPSDPERWHIDPVAAPAPGNSGARLAFHFDTSPAQALTEMADVIEASPRTRLIAGTPAELRLTYVTRSLIWGFPDYTTISAAQADDTSVVTVLSRLRFGQSDLGVNAARIEQWRAMLDQNRL